MQWLKSKIDRVRRGETTKLDLSVPSAVAPVAHRFTEFSIHILEHEKLTELNLSDNDMRVRPSSTQKRHREMFLRYRWDFPATVIAAINSWGPKV